MTILADQFITNLCSLDVLPDIDAEDFGLDGSLDLDARLGLDLTCMGARGIE
jgi:hypothetical protein